MKLRNKKTGEILDLCVGFIQDTRNGEFIQIKPEAISTKEGYLYDSLAGLNEDWEDYKPAEPLIKDEKIRKVVRLWADVNGDTRVYYNRPTIEICINDKVGYVIRSIKFKSEYREAIDIESGYYTITELCGEEKE